MRVRYLWPSPSNHLTVARFKRLVEQFSIPDDWIIEVDDIGGLHLQHPDEPRKQSVKPTPRLDTMKTSEIQLPAGSKMWLEDQIYEFEEPTRLVIESPTSPGEPDIKS